MGYADLRFYVYLHRYASGKKQGQVFYVGKGRYGRVLETKSRSRFWQNIVNKYGYTHEILMRFESESCAFSFERALIKFYGRDSLCNLSDGGEGASGAVWTQESRERLSKAHANKVLSEYHRSAIRRTTKSDSHRKKLSKILMTPEVNEKLKMSAKVQFSTDEKKAKHARSCGGKEVLRSDGVIFHSVSDAARKMTEFMGKKCAGQNIDRACRKEGYTAFGYGWKFVD